MKIRSSRLIVILTGLFILSGELGAQEADTFLLRYVRKVNDTIVYMRIIRVDKQHKLYHVTDYFENGRIQMVAGYSSFDPKIKEGWQCNYRSNTKQGNYKEWWENGQFKFSGRFKDGLATGRCRSWYSDGKIEADENRLNGQLNGRVKYWATGGKPEQDMRFDHGENLHPMKVNYPYLPYLPKDYNNDTLKKWPLIIYLHGGSQRGTNLRKLYDSGIPDQIYRGREFPFIIISPLCPLHLRWTTDDWFDNFWKEITSKYRIDSARVYLTGLSLGGNGTWYLAEKYPEKFAAIAPISGFTHENEYIDKNISKLTNIPIWAFHGKADDVVPFEETESMVKVLSGSNNNLRFTANENAGHGISWLVYPGEELYTWFLKFHK